VGRRRSLSPSGCFGAQGSKPLQSHRAYFGAIVDPAAGETLDRALLLPFRAPRSYTGEDVIEFHCHGSPYLLRRVLELTWREGARPAEPGEFTLRAFLNGKLDLAQAEAVADLIRARSEAQLRSALALHEGVLSRQVHTLADEVLRLLATVEAHIDFSEEIGELDPHTLAPAFESLLQRLDSLLQGARAGRILREGARVAIVGQPNVGKSSLLNALLGEERAITTEIPGTTRDTLEESLIVGGVPIVILDTAGLRESADVVEQIGVERARRAAERADLICSCTTSLRPTGKLTTPCWIPCPPTRLNSSLAIRSTPLRLNGNDAPKASSLTLCSSLPSQARGWKRCRKQSCPRSNCSASARRRRR
jgi:tRNA modification GTPase